MFLNDPTAEIVMYTNGYLVTVAPFYLLLGILLVVRSSVQSMGNSAAPFAACMVELAMRIAGTFALSKVIGYMGICMASPLAWLGAVGLLIVVYRNMIRKAG